MIHSPKKIAFVLLLMTLIEYVAKINNKAELGTVAGTESDKLCNLNVRF
ncbi:hypothetical protein DI53_0586 [Sphingobacterium deserti]|uniref:Uncharacterized protein n=1 Tax=Sphingobacterium deserti TaxID=1229276 RepID=A0A0B8TA62_9SPHI|nr:hypothetical protein DI53_0586 [Sphingobacterium deserti]